MNFEDLIDAINPEIYANLKEALVLGKWPDGRKLSSEQKETIMEALIYYENKQAIPEDERIGYISRAKVEDTACNTSKKTDDALSIQPLTLH